MKNFRKKEHLGASNRANANGQPYDSREERKCIDPKDLNYAIQREHFPLKTVKDMIENMSEAKYSTKLDVGCGYWQVQLDKPSSRLCAFTSPFGRYRLKQMPFGVKSDSQVLQKIMSHMLEDINGA